MEEKQISVAETIKALRKSTGLSQAKFGAFIGGAAWRTVQDWERGIAEPPTYALNLIIEKVKNHTK